MYICEIQMLINAKPAQVEQPLEGLNMLDKGQGLPQGKPFSTAFLPQ